MRKDHPRFIHYKQHEAYSKMYPLYRPFVYWVNEPLFRSDHVNTDSLGLRHNYLPNGRLVDVIKLKEDFTECNVLIGGSTVFGVDAPDDKRTISFYLSEDNVPCINLGNRGATSYQELLLFLFIKPYLPKIKNVFILSGVNDCSLASLEGAVLYDSFGGLFGQDHYMVYPYLTNLSVCYDDLSYSRLRFYNSIERRYRDNRFVKSVLRYFLKKAYKTNPVQNSNADKRASFEKKISTNLDNMDNILRTWKSLSTAEGFKLTYFLQPAMYWNEKPLTELEESCFSADSKIYPTMTQYANRDFHKKYAATLEVIANKNDVSFHDCNPVLNEQYAAADLFTDVCHLTGAGNKITADFILTKTGQ